MRNDVVYRPEALLDWNCRKDKTVKAEYQRPKLQMRHDHGFSIVGTDSALRPRPSQASTVSQRISVGYRNDDSPGAADSEDDL